MRRSLRYPKHFAFSHIPTFNEQSRRRGECGTSRLKGLESLGEVFRNVDGQVSYSYSKFSLFDADEKAYLGQVDTRKKDLCAKQISEYLQGLFQQRKNEGCDKCRLFDDISRYLTSENKNILI